ncbi:Fungal Zn2-Cys6 binuclear cluster domain-containing protein [Cladophialophora immunda]|nr:Fungal Zn2-Cys6 binuclear cluster domain-containing protein [Cladophialophora immunda]
MPGLIQSGNSSPNVRDMVAEGPPPSPADKKRNKLGYHRTAVACVHCRRRKIRCMSDYNDPTGRCQNCIRLKKECVFLPIDPQNPPTAKRPRSGAKATDGLVNEGEASVSSSSPGGILRSSSMEQINYARGSVDTPPMSNESPGFPGFHPGSRSMSAHGFDFAHGYDPNQQQRQQQQAFVPSPYSPRNFDVDSINPQFYQQHQHPYGHSVPTPYSSTFAPSSLPSTMTTMSQDQAYPYQTAAPNGAYGWANHPTRSMSSDQTDELSSGFPTPYRTNTYPSFERGMTGQMQQLPPTSSSLVPMGTESQHPPTHPNFREHTSYQTMQTRVQQGWTAGNPGAIQQLPASVDSSYSQGWYQPHPGVANMQQEEEHPHILPSQNRNPRESQHKPG